jgi:hypothetical protein
MSWQRPHAGLFLLFAALVAIIAFGLAQLAEGAGVAFVVLASSCGAIYSQRRWGGSAEPRSDF